MKISIRSTVILLPVIVAVICAWIGSHRRSRQAMAIGWYQAAIHTGRDAGPAGLVDAYGVDRARELMTRYANVSSHTVFDGSDRWAQILRVPYAYGADLGDGYTLYSLRDGIPHGWTLPEGAVLQSINFAADEIVFHVHGTITQGSFAYTIPEHKPAEYRLKWKQGTPVPITSVGELMSREYCVQSNRAD